MAYDEVLAERIRETIGERAGVSEKKMFGGIAFMLNNNMWCGVVKDTLMLRIGPDNYEKAVERPHARPMDFTGKPMKGMIYVEPEGLTTNAKLGKWLDLAVEFVGELPPKEKTPKKKTQKKTAIKKK